MSTTTADKAKSDGPRSKRNRILEVATQQFGKEGYEHTKWASVAGEVGIGQTALYHYFESKAHCLLTIMRVELTDSVTRFEEGIAGITDPVEALRGAISASLHGEPLDVLQRRILQNHMDILATPRQSEKEEAERQRSREIVSSIEQNWTDLIQRGQDAGVFDASVDAVITARFVLGTVVSVWRWYRPSGPLSLHELIGNVAEAAVRMVAAT
ncbi:TetR/AcrR family transcriptional regulator [Gordonia sp. HY002]|uniref:TetR/AcrR family transcriptional regulator n=1 Tax=Gordonia zhenghanii TaxID=2911516 RepID=UPI001EEFA544|nr:TetR/AcrR family transcriptional regulator [Gordonia zhenghanii]MCF8571900.1 TetR/AcrR family transcriptional regulator [Gordonia zhenghanii]MCF8605916.1 TetR/AcrR family transcriptional regulator [Gordonia zhenghanii]